MEFVTFDEVLNRYQDQLNDMYAMMFDEDAFNTDHVFRMLQKRCIKDKLAVIDLDEVDYEELINADYAAFIQENT